MYESGDIEKAGEFAVSIIELTLTGDYSTDNHDIRVMLIPYKDSNEKNVEKYTKKVEESKQKKIEDLQLIQIADLSKEGMKQKQIGQTLGLSQQTVSYRLGLIKKEFGFLLE